MLYIIYKYHHKSNDQVEMRKRRHTVRLQSRAIFDETERGKVNDDHSSLSVKNGEKWLEMGALEEGVESNKIVVDEQPSVVEKVFSTSSKTKSHANLVHDRISAKIRRPPSHLSTRAPSLKQRYDTSGEAYNVNDQSNKTRRIRAVKRNESNRISQPPRMIEREVSSAYFLFNPVQLESNESPKLEKVSKQVKSVEEFSPPVRRPSMRRALSSRSSNKGFSKPKTSNAKDVSESKKGVVGSPHMQQKFSDSLYKSTHLDSTISEKIKDDFNKLPSGWREKIDSTKGQPYYVNNESQTRTYVRPKFPTSPPTPSQRLQRLPPLQLEKSPSQQIENYSSPNHASSEMGKSKFRKVSSKSPEKRKEMGDSRDPIASSPSERYAKDSSKFQKPRSKSPEKRREMSDSQDPIASSPSQRYAKDSSKFQTPRSTLSRKERAASNRK
jgi:hypothetical protein